MSKQADYGDNKAENVRLRQENDDMAAKERQYKKERRENEVLKGRVKKNAKFIKGFLGNFTGVSRNFCSMFYFRISKKITLKNLIFFELCSKTNCLWCEQKKTRRSVPHGNYKIHSRKSATTSKTKSMLWRKPTKSWLKKIAHYQGKLTHIEHGFLKLQPYKQRSLKATESAFSTFSNSLYLLTIFKKKVKIVGYGRPLQYRACILLIITYGNSQLILIINYLLVILRPLKSYVSLVSQCFWFLEKNTKEMVWKILSI